MRFDWASCAADWSDDQRVEFQRAYAADEPTVWPSHDEGECNCCDALRALMREVDDRDD